MSALCGAGATIAVIVYSGFVHPLPAVLIGMTAFGFTLLAGLLYHRHQR
ncbi:MAG TPA: hypothetical protein VL294_03280 [Pseudolysinimonas sp.]|nr:hypothetical protein [Pseudolysinimonas sp.]